MKLNKGYLSSTALSFMSATLPSNAPFYGSFTVNLYNLHLTTLSMDLLTGTLATTSGSVNSLSSFLQNNICYRSSFIFHILDSSFQPEWCDQTTSASAKNISNLRPSLTRMIFTISAVRSVSRNSLLTLAVGIMLGFSFSYMILNGNYASTEMFLQQPSTEHEQVRL